MPDASTSAVASKRRSPTKHAKAIAVAQPYHHGDLRNALVDAALTTFAAHGSAVFSLSELARSLHVTPAAAYKHFADKDALMSELAARGFAALASAFEVAAPAQAAVPGPRQALQRLAHLAAAYHAFGSGQPVLFQVMFGEAGQAHRERARQSGQTSGTFERLVDALSDLHRSGACALKPKAQHAWLAWCMVHGATTLSLSKTVTPQPSLVVGKAVADSIAALLQQRAA